MMYVGCMHVEHAYTAYTQHTHLPRHRLTVDSKYSTIPWCQKIDGAGLVRIKWVVDLKHHYYENVRNSVIYLLSHVKTVMTGYVVAQRQNNCSRGWNLKSAPLVVNILFRSSLLILQTLRFNQIV